MGQQIVTKYVCTQKSAKNRERGDVSSKNAAGALGGAVTGTVCRTIYNPLYNLDPVVSQINFSISCLKWCFGQPQRTFLSRHHRGYRCAVVVKGDNEAQMDGQEDARFVQESRDPVN